MTFEYLVGTTIGSTLASALAPQGIRRERTYLEPVNDAASAKHMRAGIQGDRLRETDIDDHWISGVS